MVSWKVIENHINKLADLKPDWDDCGADVIKSEFIQSAHKLAQTLQKDGYNPPDDIYPVNDGNIFFEWHLGKMIVRIEIESPGEGQKMVSWPDKSPVFTDVAW